MIRAGPRGVRAHRWRSRAGCWRRRLIDARGARAGFSGKVRAPAAGKEALRAAPLAGAPLQEWRCRRAVGGTWRDNEPWAGPSLRGACNCARGQTAVARLGISARVSRPDCARRRFSQVLRGGTVRPIAPNCRSARPAAEGGFIYELRLTCNRDIPSVLNILYRTHGFRGLA